MSKNNIKLILKNFLLKVYSFLEETYYLSFALCMLMWLFYIRLIPRVSRDLWHSMTQYHFFSTLLKIVFVMVNIIIILRILQVLPEKKPGKFTEKLMLLVNAIWDYISGMLINFYNFVGHVSTAVVEKVFNYDHFFYHCVRYFSRFVLRQNKTFMYVILISITLIPKGIFILAFAYDVLILQQLNYTFKCIPLLLISLLEPFILFIFTHFYDRNIDPINSFMETTVVSKTEEETIRKHQFIPEFRKSPPEWFKDFNEFFYDHYVVLNKIRYFVEHYKTWKIQDSPYYYIRLGFCVLRLLLLLLTLLYNIL